MRDNGSSCYINFFCEESSIEKVSHCTITALAFSIVSDSVLHNDNDIVRYLEDGDELVLGVRLSDGIIYLV